MDTASTTTTSTGGAADLSSVTTRVPAAINPYLVLTVAMLAVSCSAIFIKWSTAPPLTIAAFRMGIATLCLAPFVHAARRAQLRAIDLPTAGLIVLSGILLALHFGFWTASLEMTSVANSVLFVNVHPVLVAALAWPLFGERTSRLGVLGIGLTLAGSTIIAGGDLRLSGMALRGDLLALLGAVVFAGYLLIGRGARQRLDVISYSVPVYAICTLTLLGLSFPTGQSLLAVGGRDLLVFLALALVCTLGGHLLYNWTLRYITAAIVSTSFLAEPVIAALLAWLLLSQRLPVSTLLGGVVVLGGIRLTAR